MRNGITEDVSKRIHSLRFILIVFVVFIHNGVIEDGINYASGTETFGVPMYVDKIYELVGLLTCTAVPLYFIISAVLLYSKDITFMENLKKKCRSILLPYISWTVLILLFLFIIQSLPFTKDYFATVIIRDFSIWDWLGAFTAKSGIFAEKSTILTPFWFLRDLFILNLFFIPIKKLIDVFPIGMLVLLLVLWLGNVNLYIFHSNALFFFAAGYYIVKYKLNIEYLDEIKLMDMAVMYGITIITGLFFAETVPAIGSLNILVGIIFMLKMSHYLISKNKLYHKLILLEKQQFFVYAAHSVLLAVLIKLSGKIMPMNGGWLLIHYFGICILCIILLVGIGMVFRKIVPKPFTLLCGGR
jgi:hypothetical protein